MQTVVIDTRRITDWESFHGIFSEAFGFPAYYGRNMNAWIDCLTYLNDPDVCDTVVKGAPGEAIVLQLEHAGGFSRRCPELYAALIDGAALVNYRLIEAGKMPAFSLAWQD